MRLLLVLLLFCSCSSAPPLLLRAKGERVFVEEASQGRGPASSRWEPRGPVIYLHTYFDNYSDVLKWWIIGHEYCHLRYPYATETFVDCCSWKWTHKSLGFSETELSEVILTIQGWHGSVYHMDGPERAYHLMRCAAKE